MPAKTPAGEAGADRTSGKGAPAAVSCFSLRAFAGCRAALRTGRAAAALFAGRFALLLSAAALAEADFFVSFFSAID